ncbi:MAG: rod shape-determining protein MreC [Proteobacteria bacterium]|nr:rod shape-determining protein MreC [Pseudomonadota bacterium]MBU1612106.1 rod shape-determining protein MreC [Pseudomonadota bacterium]
MKSQRVAVLILAGLFLYLSLYTWNLRTGHLDALSNHTGLEVSSWVLRPGKWVADRATTLWKRYVFLVGLQRENERLKDEIGRLVLENADLHERDRTVNRLERLLSFDPPVHWTRKGGRVVAQRLGPAAALETVLVDQGDLSGIRPDTPVITPDGVVGRVMRVGLTASTVLLLTDPNSAIPVISQTTRTPGVAFGRGPGRDMVVEYMNVNAGLKAGEELVTSGLAGIFPKGLPVAVISSVERSDLSLFLSVHATPLIDAALLEEVLFLARTRAGEGH